MTTRGKIASTLLSGLCAMLLLAASPAGAAEDCTATLSGATSGWRLAQFEAVHRCRTRLPADSSLQLGAVTFYHQGLLLLHGTPDVRNRPQGVKAVDSGLALLALLEGKRPLQPAERALRSSLNGLQAGVRPWKAPFIGPLIWEEMEAALAQAPTDAQVLHLAGVILQFAPTLVGGDRDRARQLFRKAQLLFAADTAQRYPWGRLSNLAYLTWNLEEADSTAAAPLVLQECLALSPQHPLCRTRLKQVQQMRAKEKP